jgi:1-acyl-sn-glycerol-3-phosphate acyltransferase
MREGKHALIHRILHNPFPSTQQQTETAPHGSRPVPPFDPQYGETADMNEVHSLARERANPRQTASPLEAVYQCMALALGLGLLAILCIGWSIVALPLSLLPSSTWIRELGRNGINRGFRAYLGCLALPGWIRLDLAALDSLQDAPPLVLAPNHPGLLDAVLILSRFANMGCVVKADLLNHPLLGAGARLAGFIPNNRRYRMLHAAVEELRTGHHLLLFPEGTRTTRIPINPLKNSPGLIASKAGAPIQTILIETNSRFLGKDWPLFRRPTLPIVIKVRLGRRFPPPKQVRTFTTELEQYFASELQRSPVSSDS